MDVCKICNELGGHKPNCPIRTFSVKEGGARDYSGRELELDLFDRVNTADPRYKAELSRVMTDRDSGYVPRQQALELVKRFQPSSPTNPKKDFFRELLIGVQDELGIDIKKNPDNVRGFTAVGTPLDKFHGVDAFISYVDQNREYVVTLDATLRPDKLQDGYKADLMISDLPAPEDNEDGYLEAVSTYAGQIAEKIKQDKERERGYRRAG